MSIKIISKIGGISAAAGQGRDTGKDYTVLTFSKKDKDSGKWEDTKVFMYPEQWAALAIVSAEMAKYSAAAEAKKATDRIGGAATESKAEPVVDDVPF